MVSIEEGTPVLSRKLAIALCIVQTTATAVLTLWADRMEWLLADSNRIPPHFVRLHLAVLDLRVIWDGINAPVVFKFGGLKLRFLGVAVGEILYIMGVAVLWFLVGRFVSQPRREVRRTVALAILLWGAILLFFTVLQMHGAFLWGFVFRIFHPVPLINALLYAVWSLILVRFGIRNLRLSSQGPHVTHS